MCQACAVTGAQAPLPLSFPPPPYRAQPDFMCYPYSGYGMGMGMTMMVPPPPLPVIKTEPQKEEKKNLEAKKDEAKKEDDKKEKTKKGAKLLIPKKHCYLHVIRSTPIWEEKHAREFKFDINRVALSLTIGDIIDVVSRKEGEEVKKWCLTEVIELGDGKWSKGRVVEYADAGKITLGGLGWSEKNGESLPPIWVVVHKK